ncbi:MAG: YggU family protein [Methanosarcina sp.]|nr:MAG: YggU family protein [Methanosarcina sp.]
MTHMSFEEAIKALDSGIIIDIEVTPGSRSLSVPSGYNEWRKRIEVKLTKNAQKGKANEQLIESLAELFGISNSDILINSGATSSKKSLLVKGVSYQRAVSVFGARLKG